MVQNSYLNKILDDGIVIVLTVLRVAIAVLSIHANNKHSA